MFCDFAFMPVGTGNGKAHGMKQLGEPAHTNAANSNKMNLSRMRKVDFVHK